MRILNPKTTHVPSFIISLYYHLVLEVHQAEFEYRKY
jgi:hypothetical protein